jgi:hypothetical protein
MSRTAYHSNALADFLGTMAALLVAVHFCSSGALAAERYALLVGVTRYDNLPLSYQLKGPANDVDLLASILPGLGFPSTNTRILAEPPVGSDRPTRAAILRELDRLAQIGQKGDYVYIHFSGHGSREPAPSASLPGAAESGGFQDIFLAADVGRWNGGSQAVAGALTSHEVGEAIRRIRARGAFVWVVFDSCHSGAMVRALPATDGDERERLVDPVDLGVPVNVVSGARFGPARIGTANALPQALTDQEIDPESGGFVGFFAAQSDEATVEMHLPAEVGDSKVQGLFTFTLARALTAKPRATYRSLGESILQAYASLNRLFPTPAFEGSSLDAQVLDTEPTKTSQQWSLVKKGDALEIEAGTLHELSKGSILAVLPDPNATEGQLLGYLEITDGGLVRSRLKPVAYRGVPALDPASVSEQAVVRLAYPKWGSDVRIALPPPSSNRATGSEAYQLLMQLAARGEAWEGGIQPMWVDPTQPADIRLMIEDSDGDAGAMLWLVPPSGEILRSGPTRTPAIRLEHADNNLRAFIVTRIGQAVRKLTLMRVLQQIASGQPESLIGLTVAVRRRGATTLSQLAAGRIPSVRDGDEIIFTVTNRSVKAVDVTMLYIDSNDRISVLYPMIPGGSNRIEQGGHHSVRAGVTSRTTGLEQLVVVAMAAKPLTPRADFSFLAYDAPVAARASEPEATGVMSVFQQAGFAVPTSRELPSDITNQVDASIFPLRIETSK